MDSRLWKRISGGTTHAIHAHLLMVMFGGRTRDLGVGLERAVTEVQRHCGYGGEGVGGQRDTAKVGRRARLLVCAAGRGEPARHPRAPARRHHLLLHLPPRDLLLAAPWECQAAVSQISVLCVLFIFSTPTPRLIVQATST